MFGFSTSYLIVSTFFGIFATAMFIYGKNIDNMIVKYLAVVLMIIPMAITNALTLTLVSCIIIYIAYRSID